MDLSAKIKTATDQGLKPVPVGKAMDAITAAVEARQGDAALAHHELVAEIKSAFERTGRPVPENLEGIAVLAREARLEPLGIIAGTQLEHDYGTFLAARAEIADPKLLVDRLRRAALHKSERAGEHAADAEAEAARAKHRFDQGEYELALIHFNSGKASEGCAQRLMAEALKLKADADLIERDGLGAFVSSRKAA